MRNLAIIPARSGSKVLINKNIRDLCGKPLMTYTLEAAVESGVFDEVMVSTDSEEYANIARLTEGINVPFLRNSCNAGDLSSSWDVVKEVLHNYKSIGYEFDMFCLLQPTSPMRTESHIKQAYELFVEKDAYSIVSVTELEYSMNLCNQLPKDNSLVGFLRNPNKYARQMNPTYYRINGAIYMCNTEAFLKYDTIYYDRSYAYIMPNESSIDIDNAHDLSITSILMEQKYGIKKPTIETYKRLRQVTELINSGKIDSFKDGRTDISDDIYVNVMEYMTKPSSEYEAHRNYIDVHYIIFGEENISITPVVNLKIIKSYDEVNDVIIGQATGELCNIRKGQYCVIMPGEAHCPGISSKSDSYVRKAVIKVRV